MHSLALRDGWHDVLPEKRLLCLHGRSGSERDHHPDRLLHTLHCQYCDIEPLPQPRLCTPTSSCSLNNTSLHHTLIYSALWQELHDNDLCFLDTGDHRGRAGNVCSTSAKQNKKADMQLSRHGDYSCTALGFFLTLTSSFLASVKGITTNRILIGSLKFHPLELLMRMSRESMLACRHATVFDSLFCSTSICAMPGHVAAVWRSDKGLRSHICRSNTGHAAMDESVAERRCSIRPERSQLHGACKCILQRNTV